MTVATFALEHVRAACAVDTRGGAALEYKLRFSAAWREALC